MGIVRDDFAMVAVRAKKNAPLSRLCKKGIARSPLPPLLPKTYPEPSSLYMRKPNLPVPALWPLVLQPPRWRLSRRQRHEVIAVGASRPSLAPVGTLHAAVAARFETMGRTRSDSNKKT